MDASGVSVKPGQRVKKEPGETKFLGLLWESLFRDNVLVCGGTSTIIVIVRNKTVACPSKTVSSDTTLALPSKYSKSVRNRKIEAISRLKAKKE